MNIRDSILHLNSIAHLPWWAVLMLASLISRLLIFPLILVQMKRFAKIAPVSPALVFLKDTWKYSELGLWRKFLACAKIYRDISKQ